MQVRAAGILTLIVITVLGSSVPAYPQAAPAARETISPPTPTASVPFVRPTGISDAIQFPSSLTELIPPAPDVPAELARYYGVHVGTWGDTSWGYTQGVTVIHRITRTQAWVMFCNAGHTRFPGRCSNGGLMPFREGKLVAEGRFQVEYWFDANGVLKGHASFPAGGSGSGLIHWWGETLTKVYP